MKEEEIKWLVHEVTGLMLQTGNMKKGTEGEL
jgi:hypothetical protein